MSTVDTLGAQVRGTVITPDDPAYEAARRVNNGMIDRRPALVVRCVDAADVVACVNMARDTGLPLAVRGGGHNVAGLGTCDGGLVIDLSRMRGVRVDPASRLARVDGGATLGDIDHASHGFGLATPTGVLSTTGIGGIALHGGTGYLTRRFGLTLDNVVEADVVTADGRLVVASEHDNADLFWALRGGGGNFGVVTSLVLRLHPVHTVVAGPVLWPIERAAEVLAFFSDFISTAPERRFARSRRQIQATSRAAPRAVAPRLVNLQSRSRYHADSGGRRRTKGSERPARGARGRAV